MIHFTHFFHFKVTIPALNDSKLIGICVYNTVVLCVVGVSVTFLIRHDASVLFIFTSSTIIVCATLTLMILFIPKVKVYTDQPVRIFLNVFKYLMIGDQYAYSCQFNQNDFLR